MIRRPFFRSREVSKPRELWWELFDRSEIWQASRQHYCWGVGQISHYNDVIMGAIASQITSLTIVYSIIYSDADQRKHQSSAALAFVRGIHRGPVNSPHKWPVTRKMFPFDDVIMQSGMIIQNINLAPSDFTRSYDKIILRHFTVVYIVQKSG